jgi:hypothetical protein
MPLFRTLECRARKVVIGVVRNDADILDTLDDAVLQSWLEEILEIIASRRQGWYYGSEFSSCLPCVLLQHRCRDD